MTTHTPSPALGHQQIVDRDVIDVDLAALLHMFWRRKILITLITLAGFCASYFIAHALTPSYVSRALVLLNGGAQYQPLASLMSGTSGLGRFDNSYIVGEIEIIRSRMVARQLVQQFFPMEAGKQVGFDDGYEAERSAGFKSLSVHGQVYNEPPPVSNIEFERRVSNVLKALSVRSVPGSSVLQIEYASADPVLSAEVANAVVDIYMDLALDDQLRASRRLQAWYDKRLEDLRADMQAADDAVQAYKHNNVVMQGRKGLLSTEQISGINSKLINARAEVAALQAKLEQIKTLNLDRIDVEAIPDIFDSALMVRLQADYARQQAAISDFAARYGPKHPKMIRAQSERADIKRSLRNELQSMEVTLQADLDLAMAGVQALEEEAFALSGRHLNDAQSMIGLQSLEREAEAIRSVYDKLLSSFIANNSHEELRDPKARIISRAVPPYAAAAPNKRLIISLGTFLSLCVGLLLALILGKLDQTLRSAFQLEDLLGVPCYASIPSVKAARDEDLSRYIVKFPGSMVAEAVRTLRTVTGLRALGDKPKVISVTSSFSGEGKTMLSTWLGRATAKAGERVIVVDCDMRRPNIHRTLGVDNSATLVEYLTGEAELEDIIQKDPLSGMYVIYARAVPHHALYLIGSERMRNLVTALRDAYDLVIIDTPACLAVSDSRVLATLSDITLYGVAWASTPRDAVRYGVKQFLDIDVPLATVLMNVDVKRQARYGYADSMYYYEEDAA